MNSSSVFLVEFLVHRTADDIDLHHLLVFIVLEGGWAELCILPGEDTADLCSKGFTYSKCFFWVFLRSLTAEIIRGRRNLVRCVWPVAVAGLWSTGSLSLCIRQSDHQSLRKIKEFWLHVPYPSDCAFTAAKMRKIEIIILKDLPK